MNLLAKIKHILRRRTRAELLAQALEAAERDRLQAIASMLAAKHALKRAKLRVEHFEREVVTYSEELNNIDLARQLAVGADIDPLISDYLKDA